MENDRCRLDNQEASIILAITTKQNDRHNVDHAIPTVLVAMVIMGVETGRAFIWRRINTETKVSITSASRIKEIRHFKCVVDFFGRGTFGIDTLGLPIIEIVNGAGLNPDLMRRMK